MKLSWRGEREQQKSDDPMYLAAREHKRVVKLDDEIIQVTGPAIVSTGTSDYEVATDLKLKFTADSHVWIKVWP